MTRTATMVHRWAAAPVAALAVALLNLGCADKTPASPPAPEAESAAPAAPAAADKAQANQSVKPGPRPAPEVQKSPIEGDPTCEVMAKHVAHVTMSKKADPALTGNRKVPKDEGVAYTTAVKRCRQARFTVAHRQCVLAGKSREDFIACNLPKR